MAPERGNKEHIHQLDVWVGTEMYFVTHDNNTNEHIYATAWYTVSLTESMQQILHVLQVRQRLVRTG